MNAKVMVVTGAGRGIGGDATLRAMARTVPMGRAGSPTEVSEAVQWLCSDAASYLHGAIADVSGGR